MIEFGEPWKIESTDQHGKTIVAANSHTLYSWPNYLTENDDDCGDGDAIACLNAAGMPLPESAIERIVACVNACRGIPTEDLGIATVNYRLEKQKRDNCEHPPEYRVTHVRQSGNGSLETRRWCGKCGYTFSAIR